MGTEVVVLLLSTVVGLLILKEFNNRPPKDHAGGWENEDLPVCVPACASMADRQRTGRLNSEGFSAKGVSPTQSLMLTEVYILISTTSPKGLKIQRTVLTTLVMGEG